MGEKLTAEAETGTSLPSARSIHLILLNPSPHSATYLVDIQQSFDEWLHDWKMGSFSSIQGQSWSTFTNGKGYDLFSSSILDI